MEQSLDDLLTGAFSELFVPSLEDGDLDFENLNSDDKFEEDKSDTSLENLPTNEDGVLHQEATGEATSLSNIDIKEDIYTSENDDEDYTDDKNDEEDFQGVGISVVGTTPEEDFTSSDRESEEESSDSGEHEEEEDIGTGEKPGDLLMSVHCSDEFSYDNKEDTIFAEGQPLALEDTEKPQVRNEERGDCDEEVTYFGEVPEHAQKKTIKGDGTEEDEQEKEKKTQEIVICSHLESEGSSDSECEHMTFEQEENVLTQCSEHAVESPYKVEASLEFPEISMQNLQDLIEEVDTEQYAEKMKDFSGDEHQEAGESFADYPSDFSSCEYVEGRGQNQESDCKSNALPCLERDVTDVTWIGKEENIDEEGNGYLYSRDLETEVERVERRDVASDESGKTKLKIIEYGYDDGGQVAESDSYSSSDDDDNAQVRRDEEHSENQDLESYKLEDTRLYSENGATFSTLSISEDLHFTHGQVDVSDFNINWDFNLLKTDMLLCEDLLTTDDTDTVQTHPSDASQCTAQDINSYSVVQREDSRSYQGSLDDSFFFNTELEASRVNDLGQLGDDEYEEERNWEQEQERIKAFYEFYDDNDETNGREERQIKVQFCAEPLSQVIHYETDSPSSKSSDRDSLSSSSEGEEDLSSAETSEEPREPEDTLIMKPGSPNTELPQSMPDNDLSNTQHQKTQDAPENTRCTRKHKCLDIMKQILKMSVVILMGPLMFWLATDQADWLSQISFF